MHRVFRKRSQKVGLPPGTLVHVGRERTGPVRLTVMEYSETDLRERKARTVDEVFQDPLSSGVMWLNVDGIHDPDVVEKIGAHFKLHPLILEDILSTDQRPKTEDHGDYIVVILKMLSFDERTVDIRAEQISLVFGAHFVISFQEQEGDVFDPIRERIRSNKGRLRKLGPDYLAYALMDSIVDNYYVTLEQFGEKVELLEEELVTDPQRKTLQEIHNLKSGMIFLRRSIWPLRELVSSIEKGDSPLIEESTAVYLRDVYDHVIQAIETIEIYREMLSGMLDIYLSSISNRMNEVMKVLTIIATIFIPLTFIAGVYGMNFEYMPELKWHWGYFATLAVMAAVAIAMLVYFKKRKWL